MSSLPVPELGDKRPRDDFTEALIRDALEEEEARKLAEQKRLEEMEAEEAILLEKLEKLRLMKSEL